MALKGSQARICSALVIDHLRRVPEKRCAVAHLRRHRRCARSGIKVLNDPLAGTFKGGCYPDVQVDLCVLGGGAVPCAVGERFNYFEEHAGGKLLSGVVEALLEFGEGLKVNRGHAPDYVGDHLLLAAAVELKEFAEGRIRSEEWRSRLSEYPVISEASAGCVPMERMRASAWCESRNCLMPGGLIPRSTSSKARSAGDKIADVFNL